MRKSPEQLIIESVRKSVSFLESLKTARQKYGDLADELKDLDPSTNFKYTELLCMAVDAGIDKEKAASVVKSFDDLLKKNLIQGDARDVQQYKSFDELEMEVTSHQDEQTKSAQKYQVKEGAEIVYEKTVGNNRLLIIMPKTEEASIVYGKGTKWCTAATGNNYFDEYYWKNFVTLYYAILTTEAKGETKVAFSVYPDGNIETYDDEDTKIDWAQAIVSLVDGLIGGLEFNKNDMIELRTEIYDVLIPRDVEGRKVGFYTKGGTQRPDGRWDFSGNVILMSQYLTVLPIKYGKVGGGFDCVYNKLASLEGAPESVEGYFNCSYNKLASLEGAPESVGGYFFCRYNNLTSLEGAPEHVEGNFNCSHNKLASLEGAPESVGGDFFCVHNKLSPEEIERYEKSGAVKGEIIS